MPVKNRIHYISSSIPQSNSVMEVNEKSETGNGEAPTSILTQTLLDAIGSGTVRSRVRRTQIREEVCASTHAQADPQPACRHIQLTRTRDPRRVSTGRHCAWRGQDAHTAARNPTNTNSTSKQTAIAARTRRRRGRRKSEGPGPCEDDEAG